MLRLLQGDVGAGKTVVALEAMLIANEAGAQGGDAGPDRDSRAPAFRNAATMLAPTGVEVALLTGRDKGRARESILMGLLDGSIDIVVGTHAIFQDSVRYRNLGLVVIDEQHRFGVAQRLMLANKGKRTPHTLAMTATPIPRTLTLAQYGEMDVSRLDELPPGRQAIDTRVVGRRTGWTTWSRAWRAISRAGSRPIGCARWCAKANCTRTISPQRRRAMPGLRERFGDDVVLVHGQLAPELKDAAMQRFASGEAKLLVATTVIEVGVDVPAATLMVIEQAERFGLAQLHQLRGRVGRGSEKSVCLLLRGDALSETGRERLALMRETQDGFRAGGRGSANCAAAANCSAHGNRAIRRFASPTLEQITRLLPAAHADARLLMERDGGLTADAGEAARILLYLFERDWGVQMLRGG